MGNKLRLLKRLYILRSDIKILFLQLTADLLWFASLIQLPVKKWRDKIKDKIYEKSKLFVQFGNCRHICRSSDIVTLLEIHHDKVYRRFSDFLPKEGDVVVDIGANIGEYAVFSAQRVGDRGKVIAFEPNKNAVMFLEQNKALNRLQNIKIIQKAACKKKKFVKIYGFPGTNVADSILPLGSKSYIAEATTMDEELKNEKKINLIKMDIEGGEFNALEGAKNILQKRPRIILEIHTFDIRKKVLNLLKKFKYKIVHEEVIDPKGCWIVYLEK